MELELLKYLPLALLVIASVNAELDNATNQLVYFKEKTAGTTVTLTTTAGRPVDYDESINALNKDLLTNEYFVDIITQLVHRKIPERIAHPKGTGAFGYFEVTHDVTDVCKAKFLEKVGKRTPIAARFSSSPGEFVMDTDRRPKSLGLKFYTEEGNFDLLSTNMPVSFIIDPIKFTSFFSATNGNPATGLPDPNMVWDIMMAHQESLYFVTYLFSDYIIPATYRNMPEYPLHTFQVVNKNDESTFLRFHILPDAGIKSLTSAEAAAIGVKDRNYYRRDLYNAIAQGTNPSWTLYIQVLGADDGSTIDNNIFDLTRVMPEDKYPLRPVGKIVLNENPVNQFAQIEQLAFNPANLVRGILGAPDKMFEARRIAYRLAQYHRLGGNYYNIAVNCPLQETFTYTRDGSAPVKDNMRDAPNYYPNSFNGPVPSRDNQTVQLIKIHQVPTSNLDQLQNLYDGMTSDARSNLATLITATLKLTTPPLRERVVEVYTSNLPELGQKIQELLDA